MAFPDGVKQQYVRIWNDADQGRAFAPETLPGDRITTVFGEPIPDTRPVVGADNTLALTITALAPGSISLYHQTWYIDANTPPVTVLHLPPLSSRPAVAPSPLILGVQTVPVQVVKT